MTAYDADDLRILNVRMKRVLSACSSTAVRNARIVAPPPRPGVLRDGLAGS